ncbi:hypothetical protein OG21DRAFT_1481245 [Imleria badia]|nr:hypothetical protein OG21DRAFT_1481245 [Imleria badia]
MYNRSRIILGVLLLMYITEILVIIVACSIYSDPSYGTVSISQLLDITVCNIVYSTQTWNNARTIIQFVLGTAMCILVTVKFVRDSLQTYRATRKWQLNIYMTPLIRDGLLYFLVTLLYSIINMLYILGNIPQGWIARLFVITANGLLYTLTPRFFMNVRELYMLDMQGRFCGDIDTDFGLSSGVGGSTTVGTMAFVEGGVTRGLDDGEEIHGYDGAVGGERR